MALNSPLEAPGASACWQSERLDTHMALLNFGQPSSLRPSKDAVAPVGALTDSSLFAFCKAVLDTSAQRASPGPRAVRFACFPTEMYPTN